ncbi:surp module domain-containing protein, putative [Eimeria brunetti]|uniref:Surp module domain-containing protein, putative n=1 Tax=Eimeria brunetti TaxID=51314 RepID=U6LQB8_9EIME|nr:surp module domain-containing protein, putative [Eimeria brunetti]
MSAAVEAPQRAAAAAPGGPAAAAAAAAGGGGVPPPRPETGEAAPTPQVPQAIRDLQQKQQQQQQQQQLLMLTETGAGQEDTAAAAAAAKREQQNPQFAFLKPSHHLFSYFASLVDAYSKCLLPQKETLQQLQQTATDRKALLARLRKRMQYERQQLQQQREKENKTQEERRHMMALDWETFHIVETIEFTEEDEKLPLAAPIDFRSAPKELPKALLPEDGSAAAAAAAGEGEGEAEEGEGRSAAAAAAESESIAKLIEGAGAEADEDEAMETEDEEETVQTDKLPPQQAPAAAAAAAAQQQDAQQGAPAAAPLRVVKGYVRTKKRQAAAGASSGFQRCPITGQLVPAEQMSQHLRILLLDPKWKEQKDRFLEKAQAESAFAPLEDVEGGIGFRAGEGLEAQEAQVEVDKSLTGAQLKQSLLDAGIGAESLRARDLQLSTTQDGPPMLDHLTLSEAGIRSSEGVLYLSVVSR